MPDNPCPGLPDDFTGLESHSTGPLLGGPLLGEVGVDDAFVWVQARDLSPLTLTVWRPDGSQLTTLTAQPACEEWLCLVFNVTGLVPGLPYQYGFQSAHGETARHRLHAALPTNARRVRIVFGSCFQEPAAAVPIFTEIVATQPHLFLMGGDNCYFEPRAGGDDWASEAGMMRQHLTFRNSNGLRMVAPDTPVLGIWDDHDFGPNDSGGGFKGKQRALRCFRRMWAQRRYGLPDTPGIFSTVRSGPVEIVLLDVRFNRAGGLILGAAQMTWLKTRLLESTAPVKLVVSGSQVLVRAAADKEWECWHRDGKVELEQLLDFLTNEDVRGVVFATGDVHLGYLVTRRGRPRRDGKRGPDLWEVTASPLTGAPWGEGVTFGPAPLYDPYVLSEIPAQNYGVVDVDLDRAGEEVRLELHGTPLPPLEPRRFFSQPVSLGSLRVRPPPPPQLRALVWPNGKAYFFRSDRYLRYDIAADHADPGYPRPIEGNWPGVDPTFEAAVVWNNGKAYFFKGNGYVRYDVSADRVDAGYPAYTFVYWRLWPVTFSSGIEAGVVWPNGKAYFFKDDGYLRYDIGADRVDEGFPQPIASSWKGLWPSGIEAAVVWPNGKAYFFRGSEYIRYDIAADRADPGYPKPIEGNWPGLPGGL